MTSSDNLGEYKVRGMVCWGYFVNRMRSVMTTAPTSMGSQKSEKIAQLSATMESHANPLMNGMGFMGLVT